MASSNKQDVDDVLESWEEIDETDVLEKKLQSIISTPSTTTLDNSNSINGRLFNNNNRMPLVNITLSGDDALRSYVPPQPTVKILKRASPQTGNASDSARIVQPKKTLQQREQEYAEARLRILGGDTNEVAVSNKSDDKFVCIQPSGSNINNNKSSSSSSSSSRTNSAVITTTDLEDNAVVMERMPRGPDGSKGFHIRR